MASGLLLRGLIAGALAGLLAACVSFFAGEPPLERTIQFETAMHGEAAPEPQIVGRSTQRGVGLFAAHLIYGAAIGGTFSLVFALALGRIGAFEPRPLSGVLALAGFLALVLVPELKYPANPPAIGAAETIGVRTTLYFALLALSLLAMGLAARFVRLLIPKFGPWNGTILSAGLFVVLVCTAMAALPPIDEVPACFPASVLWNFRIA